ncbi:hypothetical protein OIO90_001979 [Microbotryomycetes sp. JL221]|nr:hypothetical protein OIO90_001979 [Microbotryomycetes sp. JL221]
MSHRVRATTGFCRAQSSRLAAWTSSRSCSGLRFVSSSSPNTGKTPPAFCFDIDGVLKQGEHVLPRAKQALKLLTGHNKINQHFPFICVTNGGGSIERDRAAKLTKELQVNVAEHQIVQSHTIFRALTKQYADKPVFVIGGLHDRCRKVAEDYGFKHVYIPADVLAWDPSIWPFHKLTEREKTYIKTGVDFSNINFAAVLVFHDTFDYGRDIQLLTDLVKAQKGVFGTHKDLAQTPMWTRENSIPVYFSNPDLLWGNEFSQPRHGQGVFQESCAAVYKTITGYDLHRTTGGKPTSATYEYASTLLYSAIAGKPDLHAHHPRPEFNGKVFMVGDNPASDIAGANGFGWDSILVRTGVFKGYKPEEAKHVPTVVKEDVLDGVRWALEREGFGHIL